MDDETASGLALPSRRKILITLVAAALLAGGVASLIGEIANYSKLLDALGRADPAWFGLCVAGGAIAYLGYAVLFRALAGADGGPRLALRMALRVTIGAFGASVIATSAGRLGFEYWSLRRLREVPARAWARVLAINTAAWAVLGLCACLGAGAIFIGAGGRAPLAVKLVWLLVPPACLVPALWISFPARAPLAEPGGGRVRSVLAVVVGGIALLRGLRSNRRAAAGGWGGAALYWAGELLVVWGALRAFGIDLGLAPLILAYATGYASTILPMPVGGAGGVDAATTFALTLVGVPLPTALLATVVQRIFTYWLPLVVAVASVRSLRRLGGELCTAGSTRPTRARSSALAFASGSA